MEPTELRNIAWLKAEMIGVEFEDAGEAWESLFNAVGHEPNFAAADRAFAEATGGEYLEGDEA